MSKELLRRALGALREENVPNTITNAVLIKDIKTELARPEPKPVAWMCPNDPDSASAFSWKQLSVCKNKGCFAKPVPVYSEQK